LSRTTECFQAVYALLFGEVLGVSSEDLEPVAVLSAVSIALVVVLFRPLLLSSVSPELGEAKGVSARLMEVLFLAWWRSPRRWRCRSSARCWCSA
jgi:zinc/manganese transport system permease protein